MIHLVCYDIATAGPDDHRRLRAVAKFLERHGVRVQKSVFEIAMTELSFNHIRAGLLDTIDHRRDSVLIYQIHGARQTIIETYGRRADNDMFPRMIV